MSFVLRFPPRLQSFTASMPSLTVAASKAAASADKALRIHRADEYPHQVWYFLASVIGLVAVFRFLSFVWSKVFKRKRLSQQSKGNRTSLQKLPTVMFALYRVVAFRLTLDFGSFSLNLTEVVLTMMYIAALFTWTLINTTNVSGKKFDINYWSNRAGVLIASQIPLITALGTKNNLISFITGVPYEKLNYLHRMAARVVFVLIWTHAGSEIHSGQVRLVRYTVASSNPPPLDWPIRSRAYEFFFYTHLILVMLILVGTYLHTKEFNYETYIWPSFVIWGLDRVLRAVRLILFNRSCSAADATAELLTPKCVRLTLKRPRHFRWSAGQIAYLTLPDVSTLPFESHPFTIASCYSQVRVDDAESKFPSKNDSGLEPHWDDLVFLINVREGLTKRLADITARKDTVKAYLDGPYGQSHDLSSPDTIVLIAGGTGVSHTLPLLSDTIRRIQEGKSVCQRVTFIWCIRDSGKENFFFSPDPTDLVWDPSANIQWISDILSRNLSLAPGSLKIDIRIFVTGTSDASNHAQLQELAEGDTSSTESQSTPVQTTISEKAEDVASESEFGIARLPSITIAQGRPSLVEQLKEEAEASKGGSMWVSGMVYWINHLALYSRSES
ncbi:hypothetical protein D9757_003573 [Collybiopsis confluens]|uniref:ferric-chelate reductase (NADPH) n=1 Tax=Collybiopsis confluens TaxID=2823264 RepID=A0A8H5MDG9_9AGAR|nr:hypothetical protein D9757_003573 [Collybiopsis confluens]